MFDKNLKNDNFLRAAMRLPTDYTPVWMMRQAGRYLPEYNASRKTAGSFLDLAKNPNFATEVTLQPLERYPLDAAILFSDILTIPDAMGLGLYFETGEGPKFHHPLKTEKEINNLNVADMADLQYVFDAVKQIKQALNGRVPLIGFSGSPWTLACYMVEGGSSKDFLNIKKLMYSQPELLHSILRKNTESVIHYLNAQIEAGAQAVMVFDSWGGVLSEPMYLEFSLQYMQQIIQSIHKTYQQQTIPSIIFTKGGGQWLHHMVGTGCNVLGADWSTSLADARAKTQDKVALQGNLDPFALLGHPNILEQEVKNVLNSFGQHTSQSGHIFNLGHGISQFTNPEMPSILVKTVHEYSRSFHKLSTGKGN